MNIKTLNYKKVAKNCQFYERKIDIIFFLEYNK